MLASTAAKRVNRAVATAGSRSFFSKTSAMPQVAIDEEFPGLPSIRGSAPKEAKATISKTPSGLRIGSHNGDAFVSTIGVEISAGSRVENDATAGLSHLFSKMAFRSTDSRTDLRLFRAIESIGGSISTSAGRDFVRYSISVLPEQLEAAAEILAETTLAPRFAQWDVELQKQKVEVDLENLGNAPCQLLYEATHGAAFYDDITLGRPVYSADNLSNFGPEDLWNFYDKYVNAANVVLVGSGVEHSALTDVANDFFNQLPAGAAVSKAAAKYVGGEARVKYGSDETYVSLGFKGVAKSSAELPAARVLKHLLASRLDSKKVGAFLAAYEDAGVVGLSGSAPAEQAGALVDSFVSEIKKAASAAPSTEELANAKALAAREAVDEVVSRQGRLNYLAHLAATQTQAACVQKPVDAVTAKNVQELAQKAIASRPSLASVGTLSTVPRLDAVVSKLK